VVYFSPGALHPGEEFRYPLVGGLMWVPVPVGTLGEKDKNKTSAPAGIRNPDSHFIFEPDQASAVRCYFILYEGCWFDSWMCVFLFSCVSWGLAVGQSTTQQHARHL